MAIKGIILNRLELNEGKPIEVVNPGDDCLGLHLMAIACGHFSVYILVEGQTENDAIDNLSSSKWKDTIVIPESDLGDYNEDSIYWNDEGEPCDISDIYHIKKVYSYRNNLCQKRILYISDRVDMQGDEYLIPKEGILFSEYHELDNNIKELYWKLEEIAFDEYVPIELSAICRTMLSFCTGKTKNSEEIRFHSSILLDWLSDNPEWDYGTDVYGEPKWNNINSILETIGKIFHTMHSRCVELKRKKEKSIA